MKKLALLFTFAFALSPILLATPACTESYNGPSDASTDGPAKCGEQTCSTAQVCLYRECTTKDRCRPSASCPPGTTPSDCNGQPGCLYACAPKLQGCREIPSTCGGDITCACQSICGSAEACGNVDGRNVLCAATE